ncbi:hypothetical protein YYC_00145 [Plasmodium yoelii 17X]|uniref:Uncharacterized protein n=1 Tax=Plasmodium yoelii 17X TaxID=1323249 RepID=V7PUQ1_PLAYE|nr:hypothetical protein YYC_00145 [Plasmodium yoelii 17X]
MLHTLFFFHIFLCNFVALSSWSLIFITFCYNNISFFSFFLIFIFFIIPFVSLIFIEILIFSIIFNKLKKRKKYAIFSLVVLFFFEEHIYISTLRKKEYLNFCNR